ncbi:hypothetical protein D3C81_2238620 [compost metagenome]
MFRQIGTVFGTTILVVVLGSSIRNSSAFDNSWMIAAVISILGTFTAFGLLPKQSRATRLTK